MRFIQGFVCRGLGITAHSLSSPSVFHLPLSSTFQHCHSRMERRLSKGTNKMKSGTGLYILNQVWIEAEMEGGILYVMSSRLNNCSHLPSSITYSIIPGGKGKGVGRHWSWRGAALKFNPAIRPHNANPWMPRLGLFHRHKI